ncbi:fused FliR family export protein/FlhB family type III secretion system protein [Clostridium thermarum]|uniref:fused FliR family export protein/FlhB family type III secretion system protein n=1 Tax=Clostridium thermarum TaxID=1716543 RepID=UPI0013D531B5|nr:fused FliR family export protein/FlhB family type III secretion system protein [Clostridium thermarum]
MINTVYFLAVLMIFLRMLTFCAAVPIFFPKGTPNIMKVFIAGVLSFVIVPSININNLNSVDSNLEIIFIAINEVLTGLMLGFITNIIFTVMKLAGQLMDTQIGLGMINMFDPNSNTNSTLIETLLYWVSFIVFLSIDGHHLLIKLIIQSFNSISIGNSLLTVGSVGVAINVIIEYFTIGLKIAIPIVLIILITDIVLGLISRAVPQLNLMILGLPVKILVGFTALTLALPFIYKSMVIAFENLPDIFNNIFKVVPVVLIFASEDKTEEATPKKKSDARKKGQVAKSKEVSLALTLLASTLLLTLLSGYVGNGLMDTLKHFLSSDIAELDYSNLKKLAVTVLYRVAIIFLPVVIPIMAVGVVSNYIQTGFLFTTEPLKMQLSKLNPISGFKRMFSARSVVELLKQLVVVSIVGLVGYNFVKDNINDLLKIGYLSIYNIPREFGNLVISIFIKITLIMIVVAAVDYFYQWYQHKKDLKMTKQEVKEEFKQMEGDPQIKSKIKQKQREIASRRMMASVPDATVVITNPTHIAVALKYEEGRDGAPKVVAKGEDYIAIKIKEIAKENEVPIIENKPLARLIYSEVEIDGEIPVDMYQAVAEVLAVVYKMKKKKK